jgi:hypothetical protein
MTMPNFDEDNPRLPVAELKRIASYQRWVIACVLAQITMWFGILVLSIAGDEWVEMDIPILLTCILGVIGGLFALLIYWIIRDPFWASVMSLAVIVPAVGLYSLHNHNWVSVVLPALSLLALTVVNSTTTQILSRNGVKIGMFGADVNEIKEVVSYEDEEEDLGW